VTTQADHPDWRPLNRAVPERRARGNRPFSALLVAAGLVFSGLVALGVASAPAAPVPEDGLPNGRAYEQVTPVDKNGNNVKNGPDAVRAAADGGAITFYVPGGLPGAEGAQEYPYFLSHRDSDAWTTSGLLPNAASGPRGLVLGWNESLSEDIVFNKQVGKPATVYSRSTETGQLTPLVSGLGEPAYAGSSVDGNIVVLESPSVLPGSAAAEFASNVYVVDRTTGHTRLASMLNSGEPASLEGSFAGPYEWWESALSTEGGASRGFYTQAEHALSAAGDHLFFTSGGEPHRIFLRLNPAEPQSALDGEGHCTEPAAACTVEVSASERALPDPAGPKSAIFIGASQDGSKAYFLSSERLTDDSTASPDEGLDLYRYESAAAQGHRLTDLVVDPGDASGADVLGVLGISSDGEAIYFVANGVLADGAAPGNCVKSADQADYSGACSLYVWDHGEIHFVTRIDAQRDFANWRPKEVSILSELGPAARTTPDGATLLFGSSVPQTSFETEGAREFYLFKLGEPEIVCVTCGHGVETTGPAFLQRNIFTYANPVTYPGAFFTRNLSDDGRRVFFQSPDALAAGDVNEVEDTYLWELANPLMAGDSCRSSSASYVAGSGGCIYLLSTGTSEDPSSFADADPSGDNSFFFTSQSLVAQDRDELVDIYDAKVGGGLSAQNQAPGTRCSDELGCRGDSPVAPRFESPGTATFRGSGNRASKHRCSRFEIRARRVVKQASILSRRARRAARHGEGHRAERRRNESARLKRRAARDWSRARQCRRSSGAGK
jgi:hypothetical protein